MHFDVFFSGQPPDIVTLAEFVGIKICQQGMTKPFESANYGMGLIRNKRGKEMRLLYVCNEPNEKVDRDRTNVKRLDHTNFRKYTFHLLHGSGVKNVSNATMSAKIRSS